MKNNVEVIIVNFGTKELAADAVGSVLGDPVVTGVWLVDNASPDDSATYLKDSFGADPRVFIRALDENIGFGRANNLAARESQAEYLFFLNSDAYLDRGDLGQLVNYMEGDGKDVGIVAPAIYLEDGKTLQADAQGIFPTPFTILTRKTTKAVSSIHPDWVSGVAFMVRRKEFLKLGGFDDRLFMYYEDVDLCRRYREAGMRTARLLSVGIIHLGGKSKVSTVLQKRRYFESQNQYFLLARVSPLSRTVMRFIAKAYFLFGSSFRWK